MVAKSSLKNWLAEKIGHQTSSPHALKNARKTGSFARPEVGDLRRRRMLPCEKREERKCLHEDVYDVVTILCKVM